MSKHLLRAGAMAAIAVSATLLAEATPALALNFTPLDLSGLAPIGDPPPNVPPAFLLLGPTPYFDGDTQLGTFTVRLTNNFGGSAFRPVGNADGDLTLGISSGPQVTRYSLIRIDFTPLPNGELPVVRLTQTSAPAGTLPLTDFNPNQSSGEFFSVVSNGGTTTDWNLSSGTLGDGLPDNSSVFTNVNDTGTTASWRFNSRITGPVPANTVPFQYISNGTTATLRILYAGNTLTGNNSTLNISTARIPEPLTLLGSGLALGFGVYMKRKGHRAKGSV